MQKSYTTSPEMFVRLKALREGVRKFEIRPFKTFDPFSISARDVRRLEREQGRKLSEIKELSRGARSRWRRFGAQGLQSLEAVYWLTGGQHDGGIWVA